MATTPPAFDHPRIAALRAQREAAERRAAQLKTQERDLAARLLAQQRDRDRRANTRRKILIGSMWIASTAGAPDLWAQLLAQLDLYLDRDADRALFDLPLRLPAGAEG